MHVLGETSDVEAPEESLRFPRLPFLFRIACAEQLTLSPQRLPLSAVKRVTFGRGDDAISATGGSREIQIPDSGVSRQHARLERGADGHWLLRDSGSTNGVFVNGRRVSEQRLRDGDFFELGQTFYLFKSVQLEGMQGAEQCLSIQAPTPALQSLEPRMQARGERLIRFARTQTPILIHGETGTGKELAAHAVHAVSGRTGPFVPVNCATLQPALAMSALFGHRRGAFSGATSDHLGFMRAADGGTLFLDEIGELNAEVQAGLLRALQEREVVAVGGLAPTRVDVRVVCATHRDLPSLVQEGGFRKDLLARISGHVFELLPLRERLSDLQPLIRAWSRQQPEPRDDLACSTSLMRRLLLHPWPCNVRELFHALDACAILSEDGVLRSRDLPADVRSGAEARPAADLAVVGERGSGPEEPHALGERRQMLLALLAKHKGNQSAVARELGKKRQQVQAWMHQYQIDPKAFRRSVDVA